jgi:tyrosyl-tRNA synthetase
MSVGFRPVDEQLAVLRPGLEEILTEEELREKLERSRREGRPLRVKQGFDPTSPDIHLGHTVGLQLLRRFQELGHQVVLIVGDYTAMVGDPSGKSETRPRLTREEILEHAKTYQEQFFRVVSSQGCEVRFNGEWFAEMKLAEILELLSKFTVARMLERDDFEKRYRDGTPIGLHEFLYPVMQGYDSVMIEADVEIGATEQKFNLLAARGLQRDHGQPAQVAITFPVLPGLDGVRKMSKSLGNHVGILEAPEQMYGKVMSIPDDVTAAYARLVAQWPQATVAELEAGVGADPMGWKARLASRIVAVYHGDDAATEAAAHFDRVVRRKEMPDEIPESEIEPWAPALAVGRLLKETGLAPSTSEARRLILGGGVTVDGEKVEDPLAELAAEPGRRYLLKVGKRRFLRIRVRGSAP